MNTVNPEQLKAGKNCILVFRNKKINDFSFAESLVEMISASGYYFDNLSFIAFDRSEEIVRSLVAAKTDYENTLIVCPRTMEVTLKTFIEHQYDSRFNEIGILKSADESVFMLFSDDENRLLVTDIVASLNEKYNNSYEKAYIRTMGAPASKINSAVTKVKGFAPDLQFNITEKFGDCRIEIVYSDKTPKKTFDGVMRSLVESLNEYVYSLDDSTVAERLFELLKLRRMKISVAESFTGGGISKTLVGISGISEVYFEGLNTYSNEAKMQRLGVNELTLRHYGAVSEQTASEMASGLISGGNCDISISTTGIAGPKSDNTMKPVGLVYIGIGTCDGVSVYKFDLKGNRESITRTAINFALFLAYKTLK